MVNASVKAFGLRSDGSWAALPADLLRIVFAPLGTRDLLRAARVCRHWTSIAASDELWAPHLSRVLDSSTEHVRNGESRSELSLRDIFLLMPSGSKGQALLRDFARCPWHPHRHGRLTALNILRLLRCLWTTQAAFLSISGLAKRTRVSLFSPTGEWKWNPSQCRSHRRLRFSDGSVDRLVTWTLRILLAAYLKKAAVGVYLGLFAPCAPCIPYPFRLSLASASVSSALAAVLPYTAVDASVTIAVAAHAFVALAALVGAHSLLWREHLSARLALVAVCGVSSSLCGLPKRSACLPLLFKGACVGLVLAAWRVSLPVLVVGWAWLAASQAHWLMAAAGHSPL